MVKKRNVDLTPLRNLFEKENKMAFWTRVEEALVHWVKVAETGELLLLPDKEINAVAYAVAVAKATGRPVKKVVFVSRKYPFPKPEWMTENVYRASLWDILGDILGDILWDSLWVSLRASLRDSLWDSLGDSFWDSLWASLRASLWDSLGDSLGTSLWASLFFTCGFALAGDEKQFKVCLDLLKTQEQALGLGFKKDKPQTFIALCA